MIHQAFPAYYSLMLLILVNALSFQSYPLRIGELNEAYQSQNYGLPKVTEVAFCDLLRYPECYDQRVIRTQAILVERRHTRVDGGEPYVYDSSCSSQGSSTLVEMQ